MADGNEKQRTARILSSVGKELKDNPPQILKTTERKSGKNAAEKQRIAILLAKARDRGANVPEKHSS